MSIVWAPAAAAVVYFLLGAVWFTPLFGRAWDRSIGHDRTRDNGRFPLGYYLVPLASAIAIAVVLSALHTPAAGAGAGALLGAAVGTAIAAASLTNGLTPHTPHPYLFGAITGGYHLVGCTLAGLVIGIAN